MKIINISSNTFEAYGLFDGSQVLPGVSMPGTQSEVWPFTIVHGGSNYPPTFAVSYALVVSDTGAKVVPYEGYGSYAIRGMQVFLPLAGLLLTMWAIRKGVTLYKMRTATTEV